MHTKNLVSILAIVAVMMACLCTVAQTQVPVGNLHTLKSTPLADQPASAESVQDLLSQIKACLFTVAQAQELVGDLPTLESIPLAEPPASAEAELSARAGSVRDLLCEPCSTSQWIIAPLLCLAVEAACGRL